MHFREPGGLARCFERNEMIVPAANFPYRFAQRSYRAFNWSSQAENCSGRFDLLQFRIRLARSGWTTPCELRRRRKLIGLTSWRRPMLLSKT